MTKQVCISDDEYEELTKIKNGDSYTQVIKRLRENQTDINGRVNYLISIFEDIYREYPGGSPDVLVCQLKDSLKRASKSSMNAILLSNILENYLLMDIK